MALSGTLQCCYKADRVWVGRRLIEAAEVRDGLEVERGLPCARGGDGFGGVRRAQDHPRASLLD
jgi:hypothetical protein